MVEITKVLRSLGMAVLAVFFFAYGIGNALDIGKYYLIFLYIAIVLAGLIALIDISCLKRYRHYFIWMGVFILFQACTLLYTTNVSQGLGWLRNSLIIVLKITTVAIICGDESGFKMLFKIFAWLGGVEFLALRITGALYEEWRLGEQLLGNANSFASIIMVYSLGSMICFFDEDHPRYKLVYAILFVLDVYMNLLSGGRKFLLFQIVFIFLNYTLRGGKGHTRNLIIGTIITTGIVYVAYRLVMTIPVLYNHIGIRLIGLGSEEGAMGVNGQSELMRRGIEFFRQSPLVGNGIASYVRYNGDYYGRYGYAHSNYVELLADYGIIGTALYYAMHIHCTIQLIRKRNDQQRVVCLSLLAGIAMLDIFAITFNQTAFIPLLIMYIAGIVDKDIVDTVSETIPRQKYLKNGTIAMDTDKTVGKYFKH